MNVLLSNDDGIQSPGIQAMYKALRDAGHEVLAVAPMQQQSGKSHSITVFEPLRGKSYKEDNFKGIGIYGTPSDCIKIGLGKLSVTSPDLVISGINDGQNVGPDIFYSGTIGAAAEGAHAGIPSIAVSHAGQASPEEMERSAAHLVSLLEQIDWNKVPKGRVISVNYPSCGLEDAKGVRICPQSSAVMDNAFIERPDPRGESYWWMDCNVEDDPSQVNDRNLLREGYITVTPLKFDFTDYESLEELGKSLG